MGRGAEDRLSGAGSRAPAGDRFWAILPFLIFCFLLVATWRRWFLPFEDSGREMNTALRLARGETLYREVGYLYGPLAPLFDGGLLRIFGRDLDVLVAWRVFLGLLGVEALRRLARRLVPGDSAAASAVTSFAVAACAFGIGGSWPFPYSVAALAGTVGTWWAVELALASETPVCSLAAAAVAGVAAGCKLEFIPAALAGTFLVLALRRPRREALGAGFLMAGAAGLAYGIPVLRFGLGLMQRQGFLLASSISGGWQQFEESVVFGGMSWTDFAHGGFLGAFLPSGFAIAIAVLLARSRVARHGLFVPLFFAAGAFTFCSPENAWIHALLPLALCVGALSLARAALAWWSATTVAARPDAVAAGISLAMLPALLRQPFFLRNPVYGAFSAPLALVVALAWLVRRPARPRLLTALALGLTVAQAADRVREIGMAEMTLTKLPGASVFLIPAESRFVLEAANAIREVVPEGGTVGIFPEPGFLLFVTGRRNPFVDETFLPGLQDSEAEERMIRVLDERPPAALLVTNRPYPEFGGSYFGHGTLDRFFHEVSRRYVLARRIEGGPLVSPFRHGMHATKGLLLVPRAGGPSP